MLRKSLAEVDFSAYGSTTSSENHISSTSASTLIIRDPISSTNAKRNSPSTTTPYSTDISATCRTFLLPAEMDWGCSRMVHVVCEHFFMHRQMWGLGHERIHLDRIPECYME